MTPIHYDTMASPLGEIVLACDGHALVGLSLDGEIPAGAVRDAKLLSPYVRELQDYFAGDRRSFTFKIHQDGTDFQQTVWHTLTKIPFGQTISYADLAVKCGKPNAYRAAGSANGRNRIAIVVPCHRVIAADGTLGGYGGGLWRKEWLLQHEARP
jgi:methylated-DNA-[protein]-cysteine S-methyltransferase